MLICHSYVGLPEGICNYRRQHAGFSRMQEEQEPTIRAGEWDAHCKHERHWVLNKGCSSEIWNPVEPTDAWWCRIFDVPTDQLLVFWKGLNWFLCLFLQMGPQRPTRYIRYAINIYRLYPMKLNYTQAWEWCHYIIATHRRCVWIMMHLYLRHLHWSEREQISCAWMLIGFRFTAQSEERGVFHMHFLIPAYRDMPLCWCFSWDRLTKK